MVGVVLMSHHKKIYIVDPTSETSNALIHISHVRRRNDGTVLSVWINSEYQSMLFLPEHSELIGEEE